MSQLIPASNLAEVARNLLQTNIPFKKGGTSLNGMDAGGFIHYCLKQLNLLVSSIGTNTLYREIGKSAIPLKAAMSQGKVVPGAILFHVVHNGGEPAQFRKDGRGNADYASIAIDSQYAAYPSEIKGHLIQTKIELHPDKVNMIVFHRNLDYGFALNQNPPFSTPRQMIVVNGKLNLRRGPAKEMSCLLQMPPGSIVSMLDEQDGWTQLQFTDQKGKILTGWAMSQFLRNA